MAPIPAPTETALVVSNNASVFMPMLTIQDSVDRYNTLVQFAQRLMKPDKDFGVIPGTDKPTLLKPGAEKLCTLFGLSPRFTVVDKVEDWMGTEHGGEQFFYYRYQCALYRGDTLLATGEGSCNSMESKYRYRWVTEADLPAGVDKSTLKTRGGKVSEFEFAIEQAQTTGQYGKPAAYWQRFKDAIANGTAKHIQKATRAGKQMEAVEIDTLVYRVPNPDIADQVNTIQKIGAKRSFIAATLLGANASEFYTQDIEDLDFVDGAFTVMPTTATAPAPVVTNSATSTPAPAAPHAKNGNGNGGTKKPADIKCPAKDWTARCFELAKAFIYYQLPNGQPDMAKIQWTMPTLDYPVITAVNLEVAFEELGKYAAQNHPNTPPASTGETIPF